MPKVPVKAVADPVAVDSQTKHPSICQGEDPKVPRAPAQAVRASIIISTQELLDNYGCECIQDKGEVEKVIVVEARIYIYIYICIYAYIYIYTIHIRIYIYRCRYRCRYRYNYTYICG